MKHSYAAARKAAVLALAVVLTVVFSAPMFANAAAKKSSRTLTGKYLISGKAAKKQIGKKNTILVDCRSANEIKGTKGTIKGAINVTWQNISDVKDGAGSDTFATIPSEADLSKALSTYGLSKSKNIILFANGKNGWGDDGRVMWELRAAGYTKVKMVNGGFQALKSAKAKVVKSPAKPKAANVEVTKIDKTSHYVTTDQLYKNRKSYKIVDVRSDLEWKGKNDQKSGQYYGEAKLGHIKGAIHIKYTDLFQKNGTLKTKSQIEKMFSKAGIKKSDNIVTYCTAGIRSAYMQQVLEMCGYQHTYNYVQSFYGWAAAHPELVVK